MVNCILAVGSLIFLVIGLKNLDNYQTPIFFALLLLLVGTFPGFLLHRLLSAFVPRFSTYQNPKGTGTLLPILLITSQVTFGVGAIVNERIALQKESKEYIIMKKGTSASKTKAYYIFIDRNSQQERLEVGRQFYENLLIGEPVKLSLVTGRLGFKYYQFTVPENKNSK